MWFLHLLAIAVVGVFGCAYIIDRYEAAYESYRRYDSNGNMMPLWFIMAIVWTIDMGCALIIVLPVR